MKKKIVAPVLILAIIVSAYLYLLREKTFLYNGTIEAIEINLSSQISGTLKSFLFSEGDIVKEGDLIAEIDAPEIVLAYNIARRNFERARSLFNSAAISAERFDEIKFRFDEAAIRLSKTQIIAPIGGRITFKFYEDGELIMPGAKIAVISNTDEVEVNIYAAYNDISKIKIGDEVRGYLPELKGEEFIGKIIFINDKAEWTPRNVLTKSERERLVFLVKTRFQNQDESLKPGMTLEVKLAD